jgi:hypothetical protein
VSLRLRQLRGGAIRPLDAGRPVHLVGMRGLGDNVHQRVVVRALLKRGREIWLETPWPSLYHDLTCDRLHLIPAKTGLRTQHKNQLRQAACYSRRPIARNAARITVWYQVDGVREWGSIPAAMLGFCLLPRDDLDFRLPVPEPWLAAADRVIAQFATDKPILIYRPLHVRREWDSGELRNPDHAAYAQLFRSIRDRYHVISIGDFVPNVEWIVGEPIRADAEFHRGELDLETLIGLIRRAALIFAAPGMIIPLAQAVGTPSVCVFGGYEDRRTFSAGAAFTLGTMDTFVTYGAPANLIETVNTVGLPIYARQIARPDGSVIDIKTEASILPVNKRPRLAVRLVAND